MKTKIIFLCGLCVGAMLIHACKKNTDDNTPNPSGSLIKTMMIRYSDTLFYNYTLQFDDKNRLTEMNLAHTFGAATDHIKVSYNYSADSIKTILYNTDAQTIMQTEIYKLNASGLAIQKGLMMNGVYASHTYYIYDDSGFLLSDSTEYTSTSVFRIVSMYTIGGGNVASAIKKTETSLGITTQETVYAYISGKVNSVGNSNQGVSFLGRQNANPISSATFTPAPLTGPNPVTYTYDYDAQGRIITATINNRIVTTYTYY